MIFPRLMRMAVILFMVTVTTSTYSNAQITLRAFNYRPTGELGAVMKPAFSGEIGYSKTFDESDWRANISLTFIKLTPRLDSFPVYAIQSGGNGTYVLPGFQSFSKYNLIKLHFGFDYSFYNNDKMAFFAGFDLVAGSAGVAYTEEIRTYKSENYDGGGVLAGVRGRIGAEYYFNDNWSALLTINREAFLVTEPAGLFAANDYGIGIRYVLN